MNVREIKLSQQSKKFQWYKDLQEKGHLYIGSSKTTPEIFEQFRIAIKSVVEVYDDNWDLDIRDLGSGKYLVEGVVVLFPDFIITNSRGKRHNIKDLLVKVPFYVNNDKLQVGRLQGGRMTMTYAEYCTSYRHSHLQGISIDPGSQAPYFTDFCTGSGNINIFNMECNESFTEEKFTQYLLSIITLVNWESLEGTPHKEMAYIAERSNSNLFQVSSSLPGNYFEYLRRSIQTGKSTLKTDLNIYIENGVYKIRDDAAFEAFLDQIPMTPSQKQSYLCFMTESGVAYRYTSDLRNITTGVNVPVFDRANNKYIYKGIESNFQVTVATTGDVSEDEIQFKLHPELRKQTIKKLEYELNKQVIRQSTINRYSDKISNATESVGSDQVSV